MSKNIFAPIWVKKDIFHRKFDDDGYQQFVVCLFYPYYVNNIEFLLPSVRQLYWFL